MNDVAQLSDKERSEIFSEAAVQMGINPAAMEKDFWICWSLMKIFENEELSRILRFKGGTSLSKCFNLIDRFSEDIDLVLDWSLLDLDKPYKERSRTRQDKYNENADHKAAIYIQSNLLPIFGEIIAPICNIGFNLEDGPVVELEYPKSFKSDYIKPKILLEIGPLASMDPSDSFKISPYSAEIFPDQFSKKEAKVISIIAKRTFWEKVTILHTESEATSPKHRYSRHYYDVYKMLDSEVEKEAVNDLDLLEDVVRFKKHFYRSSRARYDQAEIGTYKLIPNKDAIKKLSDDYDSMREMIFGDYPDFSLIIEKISDFQEKLNNL